MNRVFNPNHQVLSNKGLIVIHIIKHRRSKSCMSPGIDKSINIPFPIVSFSSLCTCCVLLVFLTSSLVTINTKIYFNELVFFTIYMRNSAFFVLTHNRFNIYMVLSFNDKKSKMAQNVV